VASEPEVSIPSLTQEAPPKQVPVLPGLTAAESRSAPPFPGS
jgi:hypothetical protein